MTAASDPMAKAFDLMAGVFHGCSSWTTALFDCVAGGNKLVTGLTRRWRYGYVTFHFFLASASHHSYIFLVCVFVQFLSPKQEAANNGRDRRGLPGAQRPPRSKLCVLSLLPLSMPS